MMLNMFPALPEIFLGSVILVLLLIGSIFKKYSYQSTIIISLLSLLFAGYLLLKKTPLGNAFYGQFYLDFYSVFIKILILGTAILCLLLGINYQKERRLNDFEYTILVCTSVVGMMLMISADTFLIVYMGLELQSLSLYILASFRRDHTKSAESGLKYFILGSIASGFFLYGVSLIYGFAGSINFLDLSYLLSLKLGESPAIIFGVVFILSGLLFKISTVPFHMWTPDVYEGSPMPVTLFFSTVPKIAGFALLVRILFEPFRHIFFDWSQIILFVSASSMILAAFAGIAQNKIKRLISYSSIGHIGYALMGLLSGTAKGISSSLVYIIIYAITNLGFFACLLCMRKKESSLELISDLSGLHKKNPLMAFSLMVILFSLAGVPPFSGFITKLFIFQVALAHNLYILAVIGVLSSVVAAFYYIRLIKIMYFDDSNTKIHLVYAPVLHILMIVLVFVIATLPIYINPMLHLSIIASRTLL